MCVVMCLWGESPLFPLDVDIFPLVVMKVSSEGQLPMAVGDSRWLPFANCLVMLKLLWFLFLGYWFGVMYDMTSVPHVGTSEVALIDASQMC